MKKQIYLHMGLSEPSSTTLREFLASNRASLLEKGILFPETGSPDQDHFPFPGLDIDALKQEIHQSDAEKFIISAAGLDTAGIDPLKRLRNAFGQSYSVEVIVYLQRQDVWLQSLWVHLVAGGHLSYSFDRFIEKALHPEAQPANQYAKQMVKLVNPDYFARLQPWAAVFGKDHLQVHLLHGESNSGAVVMDFCNRIGATVNQEDLMAHQDRPPSAKTLEVIRYLNAKLGWERSREFSSMSHRVANVVQRFAQTHAWDDADFYGITPQIHTGLLQRCAESNARLAQAYLGKEQLFSHAYMDKPIVKYNLAAQDPQEMLALSGDMMNTFLEDPEMAEVVVARVFAMKKFNQSLEEERNKYNALSAQNRHLQNEYTRITRSKGWQLIDALRKLYRPFYQLIHRE